MKKTLRVAFFKAKYGHWDDKAINLVTGKKGYSHCEIVINANTMVGAHMQTGVVDKFHYNDIYTDHRWDVLEIPVIKNPKSFVYDDIGKPYDTLGVVCTALRDKRMCIDPNKTWCSKFVADIYNLSNQESVGYMDTNIMPNTLYYHFKTLKVTDLNSKVAVSTNIKRPEIDRYGRIKI